MTFTNPFFYFFSKRKKEEREARSRASKRPPSGDRRRGREKEEMMAPMSIMRRRRAPMSTADDRDFSLRLGTTRRQQLQLKAWRRRQGRKCGVRSKDGRQGDDDGTRPAADSGDDAHHDRRHHDEHHHRRPSCHGRQKLLFGLFSASAFLFAWGPGKTCRGSLRVQIRPGDNIFYFSASMPKMACKGKMHVFGLPPILINM